MRCCARLACCAGIALVLRGHAALAPEYTNACQLASNPDNLPLAQTLTWIWRTNHEPNPALVWTNERVKVVTWTRYTNSYVPYAGTGQLVSNYWDMVWVTAAPELYAFFADTNRYPVPIDIADAALRIEQLLGINNDSLNALFAELWVRPEDLFRPSKDTEISSASAGRDWPEPLQTPPGFASAEAYVTWFTNRAATVYTGAHPFPWTQLGYTYDWCPANTSVIGLSEYVLKQNAEYTVARAVDTLDYIPVSPEPGALAAMLIAAMTRAHAHMRSEA